MAGYIRLPVEEISLFLPLASIASGVTTGVAITWPHWERRVEKALARGGFEFYLPKWRTPKKRIALLFPRYIFVGPIEQWMALREIYGVSRILRAGGHPAVVEERTLESLKAREDREGLVRLPQKHIARLRIGQRVRIQIGPFAGKNGVYRGRTTKKWERVDLPVLGQVVLPTGNLVAE